MWKSVAQHPAHPAPFVRNPIHWLGVATFLVVFSLTVTAIGQSRTPMSVRTSPQFARSSSTETVADGSGVTPLAKNVEAITEPYRQASIASGAEVGIIQQIHVSECEATTAGQLLVELYRRESRKDGTLGKIKKAGVARSEVARFTNADDRELLEVLLTCPSEMQSYGYGYQPYHPTKLSRVVIPAPFFDTLLPKLCATGRFRWMLDGQEDIENAPAVAWDDGPAWQLRQSNDVPFSGKCFRP